MKRHALTIGLSHAIACAALLPAGAALAYSAAPDGAADPAGEPRQLDTVVVQGEITYRNRTTDIAPVLSYDLEYFQRFEPSTVGDMIKRLPSAVFVSDVHERRLAEAVARLACQGRHEFDVAHLPDIALNAWLAWYASTPDAPCIAICSTAQGDAVCKGCGRTEHEVQHWPSFSPFAKRAVWRRITLEGTAWRFNRYAERGTR